ncbi:MAG: hypothetical protein JXA03_08860 [Bacteroidales bacterium]|nr:hypothetical protein [Bacteroidales bacterium]
MKNKSLLFPFLMIFFGLMVSCTAQTVVENAGEEETLSEKTEVFYFHNTRRCATCQAVEDVSQKALLELYPEKMKSGEITFLSVDLEEKGNEALIEKLKISGQTLLIVKGDRQENLTNTAFMHARSNPEKLKKAIQESIENL